jgi:signal transduction histidine kinase
MTRSRLGRTGVATLLVAVGVIVPCAAWWFVGSAGLRAQVIRIEAAPLERAEREARRLAEQIGLRLEALRQSESRRPFEEYLSGDEFLPSDCATELAIRSPLSRGPVDPLIWAHFQIDDLGLLTLPTLGEGSEIEADARAASLQVAIRDELECASADHLVALHRSAGVADSLEVPTLSGVITVSPFSWHATAIREQPSLVAIREVTLPSAVLTQGFVVLTEGLLPMLEGSSMPATFHGEEVASAPPRGDGASAPLQIVGDAWWIRVDAADAVDTARRETRALRTRFLATFGLGSVAALLAGCAVILLVWRTDRLARERAGFAAAAAHELRTPLASLQLFGEMLAAGSGDRSKSTDYAQRIADESQRLGRVVTNMLGLSRLERGDPAYRATRGDLAEAVRDSVARLGPGIEHAGACLELDLPDDATYALFDRDAVHQILQNLLDNAEKYSRSAADRTLTVRLESGSAGPRLSVIDRGPGVPRAVRKSLFRGFGRGDRAGAPEGLGIGLPLVRATAEALGAEVTHQDEPGGGSRFSVLFRRAE